MANTPLIKPLNVQGGTFFTFTSAGEDLSLIFNQDTRKFRFSKYVLLNLPDKKVPAFAENSVQFDTIDSSFLDVADGTNELVQGELNIDFIQSFQNYCLNLESAVTSDSDYDREFAQTVSERIFFKWLKELGVIRFQNATSAESQAVEARFKEEDEILTGTERYDNVIQYVGDIDIINSVANEDNAYTEVYVHVPNEHGSTPVVLLKSYEDANYSAAQIFRHTPDNPLNIEYLYGREYNDSHPAGLSTLAIFDQDVLGDPNGTVDGVPGNWYDPLSGPNAYFTEDTFGNPITETVIKTKGSDSVTYKRSKLDGIMIDFDATSYKPIQDNPTIQTLDEFNTTASSQPFEFNAVLVYYDIYDPLNPEEFTTNLYGILFLEDWEPTSLGQGRIPRFKKFKPNPVTKLNGNAYGFKLNIKFDTSIDNVGVEKDISVTSSVSLEIFTDTTNILQQASTQLLENSLKLVDIQAKVAELEDLIITGEDANEISIRLQAVEDSLVANNAIFATNSALLDLINNNSDQINALVNGETTLDIAYNSDVLAEGEGIFLDKTVLNKVKIVNKNQIFNIDQPPVGDVSLATQSTPHEVKLRKFGNYYRHENPIMPIPVLTEDLYIRIDDTDEKWKRGQKMRLVFHDKIDVGTWNIVIVTDAEDKFGLGGAYNKIIAILSSDEFDPADNRPIVDVVCINEDLSIPDVLGVNQNYVVDQIR